MIQLSAEVQATDFNMHGLFFGDLTSLEALRSYLKSKDFQPAVECLRHYSSHNWGVRLEHEKYTFSISISIFRPPYYTIFCL